MVLYKRSYSFPYLQIARVYNVDYRVVLMIADTHEGKNLSSLRASDLTGVSVACLVDIREEVRWQHLIRSGDVAFDAPMDRSVFRA